MLPIQLVAWDAKVDNIYYNFSGSSATVTYGHVYNNADLYKGSIVIPSTVSYNGKNYTVTAIGYEAFVDCKYLKEISVPNTVNTIGINAFTGCTSLENVKLEDGPNSLSVANSTTTLPSGSQYKGIFRDCSNLKIIHYGRNLTYKTDVNYPYPPFYNTSIEEVEIGKNIVTIDKRSFRACGNLKSVTFQGNVTSIGEEAFSGCTSLEEISLPSTVTSIGSNAFSSCGIISIDLPEKLSTIGSSAFSYCNKLKEVTIPKSVRSLSEYLFRGCTSLSVVGFRVPISVTTFGRYCFMDCKSLSEILIPSSVTSVKAGVFKGCSTLSKIHIDDLTKWMKIDFSDINGSDYSNPLYYGHYLYVNGVKVDNLEIPNTISKVGDYTFHGLYANSLIIPSTVTDISSTAFLDCQFKELTLGCKTVKEWFRGLANIKILRFDDNVETIEGNAFSGCTGLTELHIPKTIKEIGCWAFNGCSKLSAVYIEDLSKWCAINFRHSSSKDNHTNPLYYAHNLYLDGNLVKDLVIPNGVTEIKNDVFAGCNMSSVSIPPSVRIIGTKWTFEACTNLKAVYISDLAAWCNIDYGKGNSSNYENANPLKYAHNLYLNNKLVTEMEIPETVTNIKDWNFDGATCLKSVVMPSTVTTIGYKAFNECSEIEFLNIPNASIGNQAFFGCNKLKEVVSFANTVIQVPTTCTILVPPAMVSQYRTGNVYAIINKEETQSTITVMSSVLFSLKKAKLDLFNENNNLIRSEEKSSIDGKVIFTDIAPNKEYTITIYGTAFGKNISGKLLARTMPLTLNIEQVKATNLTMTIKGVVIGDAKVNSTDFGEYGTGSETTITGLYPGQSISVTFNVTTSDGSTTSITKWLQTQPVTASVSVTVNSSSCTMKGAYSVIDATVESSGFRENNFTSDILKVNGLEPNRTYSGYTYYVNVKEGGSVQRNVSFGTKALTLKTAQPKVISVGNVIVAADTNLDDEEENVGFEWRRTDWTDDFASNTGTAALFEGRMEGYIRNLNTEKLWKVRPYYLSNSGIYYYGDWMGIDPTNTSYFEPTVHTYAKVSVEGNTALIKGYALRGTDGVKVQGFKYWKQVAGARGELMASNIPANAKTVEASGQVMTANLTGLDYESEYCYVAFITTTEGESFYGEQQVFKTGEDVTGVECVSTDQQATVIAVYDMNGRRIDSPLRGLNILRMSDGTTRKVMRQ